MIGPGSAILLEISVATAYVGNGVLLASVVALVALAWRQGFFVATLAGLALLLAFVVSLAWIAPATRLLVDVEVPAGLAPGLAYAATFGGLVLAGRMLIGRFVPEQAVWYGTVPGRLLGIGVGILAGIVLAGGILVGWSLASPPRALALVPQDLVFDAGAAMLEVFGRFVEPDRLRRRRILGGGSAADAPPRPAASEPFFDANTNCIHDADERYLDRDGDGRFTLEPPAGTDAAAAWSPGLLDCYALGAWRNVVASHRPRLTSPASSEVDAVVLGEGLYQATAEDRDACDQLAYAVEPGKGVPAGSLVIDPATGRVGLSEEAARQPLPEYRFTVSVTDRAGLVAKQAVEVEIKNLPAPPGP